MAELFARINMGLRVGTLDLDFDSGEMASRTGVALGRSAPDREVVTQLLGTSWQTVETFFPVIIAVLRGEVSPKEAVDAVNRGLSPSNGYDDDDPDEDSGDTFDDIQRGLLN